MQLVQDDGRRGSGEGAVHDRRGQREGPVPEPGRAHGKSDAGGQNDRRARDRPAVLGTQSCCQNDYS
ncbi:hypothetical protein Lfu02_67460 [Longispora fulva]|nr:hypothetical protein Lfu02_67460 [Longispora fulva]